MRCRGSNRRGEMEYHSLCLNVINKAFHYTWKYIVMFFFCLFSFYFPQYCVVPLCFCALLVVLEPKLGNRMTASRIKHVNYKILYDAVGDFIVGFHLLCDKAINIHLKSLQCAPWKLESYTISRVIDPWQLCKKKKEMKPRWVISVGSIVSPSNFTRTHPPAVTICIVCSVQGKC